jgi:hypothetical protein
MEPTKGFTRDEASGIADLLALDFSKEPSTWSSSEWVSASSLNTVGAIPPRT